MQMAIGRMDGVVRFLALGVMLVLGACATPDTYHAVGDDGGPVPPDYRMLAGWNRDNHAEAVPALLRTCGYLHALGPGREIGPGGRAGRVADWQAACTAAKQLPPGNGAAARPALISRLRQTSGAAMMALGAGLALAKRPA